MILIWLSILSLPLSIPSLAIAFRYISDNKILRSINAKFKDIFHLRLLKNKMFGSVFNITTTVMMILTGETLWKIYNWLINELYLTLRNYNTNIYSHKPNHDHWSRGGGTNTFLSSPNNNRLDSHWEHPHLCLPLSGVQVTYHIRP